MLHLLWQVLYIYISNHLSSQVSVLLFILSQCSSKRKIYCFRYIRSRDRQSRDWIEAWGRPARTYWWDILWNLWQICSSKQIRDRQLFYLCCEWTFSFAATRFCTLNSPLIIYPSLFPAELRCNYTLRNHSYKCHWYVQQNNRKGKFQNHTENQVYKISWLIDYMAKN